GFFFGFGVSLPRAANQLETLDRARPLRFPSRNHPRIEFRGARAGLDLLERLRRDQHSQDLSRVIGAHRLQPKRRTLRQFDQFARRHRIGAVVIAKRRKDQVGIAPAAEASRLPSLLNVTTEALGLKSDFCWLGKERGLLAAFTSQSLTLT